MQRLMATLVVAVLGLALPALATAASESPYSDSFCVKSTTCRDVFKSISPDGDYTGHDEPSVQFTSKVPGSGGGDLTYTVILPKNPPQRPKQGGGGGAWDFQLRATFWLGLAMCDTESSPNYRKSCAPDSDANARYRSANPKSPFYIGKSPGNAFLELQFYSPGWVPQFAAFGCTRTQWCANMTIDSLSDQDNTGVQQNADCLNNHFLVGEEPINWAYITRSGRSQAPANPLALSNDPNLTGLNPDPTKDLLMNSGDTLRIHMHDTHAGFRVDITDLTTGQKGSMTASKANGFGQVKFEPKAKTCHVRPYAFHPMYRTAVARGNTWAAHTGNVAFSDEIGHFESCNGVDPTTGACTKPAGNDTTLDDDDQFCLNGADFNALVPIIGCTLDDGDFDGVSYGRNWPGTFTNASIDAQYHETPVMFSVPTSHGKRLEGVTFENNLPNIERNEFGSLEPQCNRDTGAHCVNPPRGAQFYPIYTTRVVNGTCMFQQGGAHIPGTVNAFGGTSATEYGTKPLFVTYAGPGFKPQFFAEDFQRTFHGALCPGH